MAIQMVERKLGYNGCDNCPDFDNNVIPTAARSYKLCGFCYRHKTWVTLLDNLDLSILKCEGSNVSRINKR